MLCSLQGGETDVRFQVCRLPAGMTTMSALLPDRSTGREWRVPAVSAIHARAVDRLELVDGLRKRSTGHGE